MKSAWEFEILYQGEAVGTLTVHTGTGHWSQPVRDGNLINEMVYAYEATVTTNAGEFRIHVTRDQLVNFRQDGHAQALEQEASES